MAQWARSSASRTSRIISGSPFRSRWSSATVVRADTSDGDRDVKAGHPGFEGDRSGRTGTGSGLLGGNAEVTEHVPPDAVNMVGAVLGVIELDQEGRALDAVAV